MKKEFKIEEGRIELVNNILRNINSRKAARPGKISQKVFKMSTTIIGSHLTNIINSALKNSCLVARVV